MRAPRQSVIRVCAKLAGERWQVRTCRRSSISDRELLGPLRLGGSSDLTLSRLSSDGLRCDGRRWPVQIATGRVNKENTIVNSRSISVVAALSVISVPTAGTFIGRTTADEKDSNHFHPFAFQPDTLVVSRTFIRAKPAVQVGWPKRLLFHFSPEAQQVSV